MQQKNESTLAYDFKKLCNSHPALKAYVITNPYENESIDFSNPKAVKELNKAILFTDYAVKYWDFPEGNLCPAIPGRAAYLKALHALTETLSMPKDIYILDIGTGATCIYPLLGNALFQWHFVATDIATQSLKNAQKIIDQNELNSAISLRAQPSAYNIFKNILQEGDKFTATICNPPFYGSQEEADKENKRKMKGLGQQHQEPNRNFSGNSNELWVQGGEMAFIKKYIHESLLFKDQCLWFTILVSKKENIRKTKVGLKKLNTFEVRSIPMQQGNKMTRILAWTYVNKEGQKKWHDSL